MVSFLTIIVLITLFILWNTVAIVPMREAFVIERLGKFTNVLEAGLHFLIPFVDRISYRHEIREQVMDIPPQSCISKDNIQIEVDGLVYLKVEDARLASYGIEDYRLAAINLAQTTMRSEVGKLTLGQTFSEREKLNDKIVFEIDRASEAWGIKVLRYEVMNIRPSSHVVTTLEKQMEAERDKRAEITLALAEKESRINLSEGDRQYAINLSEGKRQEKINISKGRAKEIELIATAKAQSITMIAKSISEPGGNIAVKLQLVDQFVDELGEILEGSDVAILPAEMANIKGVFEGISQVSTTVVKG